MHTGVTVLHIMIFHLKVNLTSHEVFVLDTDIVSRSVFVYANYDKSIIYKLAAISDWFEKIAFKFHILAFEIVPKFAKF